MYPLLYMLIGIRIESMDLELSCQGSVSRVSLGNSSNSIPCDNVHMHCIILIDADLQNNNLYRNLMGLSIQRMKIYVFWC